MKIRRTKHVNDLFKPIKKGDSLMCVYLYGDGHACASFERRMPDLGYDTVTYYKQIDSIGVRCSFQGRIVFSTFGGVAWLRAMLAAGVTRFSAVPMSLEHGSPNSQAKGVSVGFVEAQTPFGTIHDYEFSVMSAATHYQADVVETFDPNLEDFGLRSPIAETLITAPEVAATVDGGRA